MKRREYTPEEIASIERSIREGRGIKPALRDLGIPHRTFYDEMSRDESLRLRIDAAQHDAAHALYTEALEQARGGAPTRFYEWAMSRLCPEQWGDPKQRVEVTGADGAPLALLSEKVREALKDGEGDDDEGRG